MCGNGLVLHSSHELSQPALASHGRVLLPPLSSAALAFRPFQKGPQLACCRRDPVLAGTGLIRAFLWGYSVQFLRAVVTQLPPRTFVSAYRQPSLVLSASKGSLAQGSPVFTTHALARLARERSRPGDDQRQPAAGLQREPRLQQRRRRSAPVEDASEHGRQQKLVKAAVDGSDVSASAHGGCERHAAGTTAHLHFLEQPL